MFEQLSDKLNTTFERLRGRARVSESDLEEALRDVRVALLEADVNFKVVRQLVATVRERALGEKVLESITGAQQVVKIVHDALVEMLGGEAVPLARAERPPTVLLLVGLQGSGKTTTAAKLANVLRKQGRRPLLVAADVHRPAAIEQLRTLGKQLGIPVMAVEAGRVADDVAAAVATAGRDGADSVIVDSAGRLHIDDEMMREVVYQEAGVTRQRLVQRRVSAVMQEEAEDDPGEEAHLPHPAPGDGHALAETRNEQGRRVVARVVSWGMKGTHQVDANDSSGATWRHAGARRGDQTLLVSCERGAAGQAAPAFPRSPPGSPTGAFFEIR